MVTVHLTPTQVLAALGVLLTLVLVLVLYWRFSVRAARRAADTARTGTRLMSLTGRTALTAAGIVGVQWIVITHPGNTTLLLVVLGLPAVLASYTLTRALTVLTEESPRSRRDRR
ncbi:hypothetical protein CDG81_13400 [Actinopolyspora erythraea]|uniref:Uncharacterized protein n=1 Tax=Actinopolyspora erythraea TaxID=414996 RepID=A0A223RTB4_9ACTN|nr:hypothetical protein CDG81_13400 [Actinopolyspora erythraea]